jgi:phosphoglycolate phosphatase-like HAD superfamily hydrolase
LPEPICRKEIRHLPSSQVWSEVIRHLSANHKIAIVTTNSSQNVHAFLTKHGLDGLIHAVYGVDTPGSKAQKISMARSVL